MKVYIYIVNFSPKIFRLGLGIFRNFWDCVRTVRAEFRDYFRPVQIEISGL